MADGPDNMTLRLLREIRADVAEIKAKVEGHDRRFDALDKRFDEMRGYTVHALGFGAMNEMKGREIEARMEAGEAHAKLVDAKFSDLERRVLRIEESID